MPTINTRQGWDPEAQGRPLDSEIKLWIYNSLDCCITREVHDVLEGLSIAHRTQADQIYGFSRALQGPYLDMMLRGFRTNIQARAKAARAITRRLRVCGTKLNRLARVVWDKDLNPQSPPQLKKFFFEAMRIPPIFVSQKGVRRESVNREALEKIEEYFFARPFVTLILHYRDLKKQLEIFTSEIDSDGRFRAGYNIAGTETGRPSSNANAFGTGRNAQNIPASLRYPCEADPGYKLVYADLEQTEARDVGFLHGLLFGDWSFLDACESGDLHTLNAMKIWPDRRWSADMAENKVLANEIFYREFTFRDMAKRGGHLSHYSGTAWTASRSLKVPIEFMEDFQRRYCRGPTCAYPAFERWWQWTAEQIQRRHWLETPFGRVRHFFGRASDPATLREAIAFMPQSMTADRMNLGLLQVWLAMPEAQFLAQTYDSITLQLPDDSQFDARVQRILRLLEVPLSAPNGRKFVVPADAKVGWNWSFATASNPDGLKKFRSNDPRKRTDDPRTRINNLDLLSGR